MSKKLDEKAAEALRQLGHTEDEIAELAQKQKALPDEENVVEKEDTATGAEIAPAERETFWVTLGKKLGFIAPVASEPEEAERDKEVTVPATTAEPADAAVGAKAEGDEPSEAKAVVTVDATEDVFKAMGEAIAKMVGEQLLERDKRIGELEAQIKALNTDIEEKVEQRLRDVPPVVKVAASQVAATAAPSEQQKGLTFGSAPQGQESIKSLLADINTEVKRIVKEEVAHYQV